VDTSNAYITSGVTSDDELSRKILQISPEAIEKVEIKLPGKSRSQA
jgi:hypothetical protein